MAAYLIEPGKLRDNASAILTADYACCRRAQRARREGRRRGIAPTLGTGATRASNAPWNKSTKVRESSSIIFIYCGAMEDTPDLVSKSL